MVMTVAGVNGGSLQQATAVKRHGGYRQKEKEKVRADDKKHDSCRKMSHSTGKELGTIELLMPGLFISDRQEGPAGTRD